MRRYSTWMEFITLKAIEYGQLIVQLPIPKVVFDQNESFRKRLWFGSEFVLKMYPLWWFSRMGPWNTIDTSKRCFQLLSSLVITCFCNRLDFPAKAHIHAKSQEWCAKHFPYFIDKDHWPPNSPDLNPLDYSICGELAHQINWDTVTSKTTLISELKRSVRKVSLHVVFWKLFVLD